MLNYTLLSTMFNFKNLFRPIFKLGTSKKPKDAVQISLLIERKDSLQDVLSHPDFTEELSKDSECLIDYLCLPSQMTLLIEFISMPSDDRQTATKQELELSWNAFQLLSRAKIKITAALFSNDFLLTSFFLIARTKHSTHSTSQGYFLEICKSILESFSIQRKALLSCFNNPSLPYLFSLIENLTPSNSQLLKLLMSDPDGLRFERKVAVFNYIVFYYLNAKFQTNPDVAFEDDCLANVVRFFEFLEREELVFEFKQKYIMKLVTDKTDNGSPFFIGLFKIRVSILSYLARTGQVTAIPTPEVYFNRVIDVCSQSKTTSLLFSAIRFFKTLSESKEFVKQVNHQFIASLFKLVIDYPTADVLHSQVFDILSNCRTHFACNNFSLEELMSFVQQLSKTDSVSTPSSLFSLRNRVSLERLSQFLDDLINSNLLSTEQLTRLRKLNANLSKNCTQGGSIYNESRLTFRTEAFTTIKTNEELIRIIDEVNNVDCDLNDTCFQITPDALSCRSLDILSSSNATSEWGNEKEMVASLLLEKIANSESENSSEKR